MAYIPNGDRGAVDSQQFFCTEQSIPKDGADDISENRIDLINTAPNLRGLTAFLCVKITTKISVASGTASQLYINLLTDASGTSTIALHSTIMKALITLGYNDAKGIIYRVGIPRKVATAFERYLALSLEPVSDDTLYSAGAIDAWLDYD